MSHRARESNGCSDVNMDETPDLFEADSSVIIEHLPFAGPALLDEVEVCLNNSDTPLPRRLLMVTILEQFATLHPSSHMRVTVLVERALTQYTDQSDVVNAALVNAAVMLQADNLMPLVREAFEAGAVSSGTYADADEVESELKVLDSSFLNGLQSFMHDKELDELRLELAPLFAKVEDENKLSSVSELDGFMHAVCASPYPVESKDWMEAYTPLLDLEEQGEETQPFRVKLETYFDEVLDSVMGGQAEPYLENQTEQLSAWASGFLKGLSLWHEKDRDAMLESEIGRAFVECLRGGAEAERVRGLLREVLEQ